MSINDFIKEFSGQTEEYKFYNGDVTLRYDVEGHEYLRLEGEQFITVPGVTTIVHIIDKSNALVPWAAKMVAEKILRLIPKPEPTVYDPLGVEIRLAYDQFEKLVLEAKSAPRDKVEEAADVGKIAHNWIEQYIKSVLSGNECTMFGVYPDNPKSKSCVEAALDWMFKHKVKWVCTERKVYSKAFDYAGTMDGLAYVSSCDDKMCCPNEFVDRLSLIDWKSSNYLYIEYILQTAAYQQAYEEETGEKVKDRWIIRLGKEDGKFEPWHFEEDIFEDDIAAFVTAIGLYRFVQKLNERMKIRKNFIKEQKKANKPKKIKKSKKDIDKLANSE